MEGAAVPLAIAVDPIAGDAGGVLHNGYAAAGEFIKEHGLAHIGAADYGDDGLSHGAPPFKSNCAAAGCGHPALPMKIDRFPQVKEKKRVKRPSSHSFVPITSLPPQRLLGHCRCRKPCKLCGAGEAHRTWGKQRRRGSPASSENCVSCLFSPWILYTWVLPFGTPPWLKCRSGILSTS